MCVGLKLTDIKRPKKGQLLSEPRFNKLEEKSITSILYWYTFFLFLQLVFFFHARTMLRNGQKNPHESYYQYSGPLPLKMFGTPFFLIHPSFQIFFP